MVPVPFKPTFFSAWTLSPYQTYKHVAWKLWARSIAVPGLKKRSLLPIERRHKEECESSKNQESRIKNQGRKQRSSYTSPFSWGGCWFTFYVLILCDCVYESPLIALFCLIIACLSAAFSLVFTRATRTFLIRPPPNPLFFACCFSAVCLPSSYQWSQEGVLVPKNALLQKHA